MTSSARIRMYERHDGDTGFAEVEAGWGRAIGYGVSAVGAIAMAAAPFLLAGCATPGTDSAASAHPNDTDLIPETEQIEIVSSAEIVEGGEQTVCRYVIPAGSRIARRYCQVYDPIEATVDDMINREVVEQMRESSLRRRRSELERMTRGGPDDR